MNKIVFKCDCGKTVRIDERHAGCRGRCPYCQGVIKIPGHRAVTAEGSNSGKKQVADHQVSTAADIDTSPPVARTFLPRMHANRVIAGQLCTMCQTKIEVGEEVQNCTRCQSAFHASCWDEVGGCGTYGCAEAPGPASLATSGEPPCPPPPADSPAMQPGDVIGGVRLPSAAPRIAGIGCPTCGSANIKQKRHTSGLGWGLFFGGIVAAFFTCGAGLVLCVIAVFLNERRGHCRDCGWEWKS